VEGAKLMRTLNDIIKEHTDTFNAEQEVLSQIRETYEKAVEVCDYYNKNSGKAYLYYTAGRRWIEIHLTVQDGKHPLKEANILMNEMFDFDERYVEKSLANSKASSSQYFEFVNGEFLIMIIVVMKKSVGCQQVGTGRYIEILEWRCV
jgi:hypothetical protein